MWLVVRVTLASSLTNFMADVFRRTPPLIIYTAVSAGLLAVVVARALDTYQNFFAAAFALSHSNGSILVSNYD